MAYQVYSGGALVRGLRQAGFLLIVLTSFATVILVVRARVEDKATRERNDTAMRDDPVEATYSALEVATFQVIHELGTSPSTSEALLQHGLMAIAVEQHYVNHELSNPYSGGAIKFVQPGEDFQPGDCLYLPAYLYAKHDNVIQAPKLSEFYLLVFGPAKDARDWPEICTDFDLDGVRDPIVFCGGSGLLDFKMSPGSARHTESLEEVLKRLGLEKYWLGDES